MRTIMITCQCGCQYDFNSTVRCPECQMPQSQLSNKVNEENPLEKACNSLKSFLLEKNKRYGNSVLEPLNVFTTLEPENGACVRIDDKLSRIKNATELRKNDIVDLAGYLILLCTQKGWTSFEDLID